MLVGENKMITVVRDGMHINHSYNKLNQDNLTKRLKAKPLIDDSQERAKEFEYATLHTRSGKVLLRL